MTQSEPIFGGVRLGSSKPEAKSAPSEDQEETSRNVTKASVVPNVKKFAEATAKVDARKVQASSESVPEAAPKVAASVPAVVPEVQAEVDNPLLEDDSEEVDERHADQLADLLEDDETWEPAVPKQVAKKASDTSGSKQEGSRRRIRRSTASTGEERAAERERQRVRASRFVVREADVEFFKFLGEVRYATSKHYSILAGDAERASKSRVEKLYDHGYLEKWRVLDELTEQGRRTALSSSVYYLSSRALQYLDVEPVSVPKRDGAFILRHTLEVNRIHASLLAGIPCELGSTKYPADWLVAEPTLSSTMEAARFTLSGSFERKKDDYELLGKEKRRLLSSRFTGEEAPEWSWGNEWLLCAYEGRLKKYHVPDLVVRGPRTKDGQPTSVAVEVELNLKRPTDIKAIMEAYAREFKRERIVHENGAASKVREDNSFASLAAVYWVCKGPGIEKALRKAADAQGIEPVNIKFFQLGAEAE